MKFTVKDILEMEGILALGCTEPVAIALGAAAAATLLPEKEFDAIEIWIDPNIYKNGLAVTIPGTGGMQGLDTAAGAAVQAALFSLHGVNVKDTDGIIGNSTQKTIQNMGALSHDVTLTDNRL